MMKLGKDNPESNRSETIWSRLLTLVLGGVIGALGFDLWSGIKDFLAWLIAAGRS